jgi:hypothetical protein
MNGYCCESAKKWQEERDAWFQKWPDSCKQCEGWGMVGDGYDHETGFPNADPCNCTLESFCPRCGDLMGSENGPCASCAWDFNDEDRGAPPPVECDCPARLKWERGED